MAEHDDHLIGPKESTKSVHDYGHAFGFDVQQNLPPPNQQFFNFMQGYRPPPMDEEIFVKLKKYRSEEFIGTTDPAMAKEWLRKFERIAERFNCTPE